LVETGEAVALCANPKEAYTRQLIAATPELPAGATEVVPGRRQSFQF
jgi:ABC-type dipeptide/oligopeptide/nickel transport system ATPase component